MSNTHAVVIGGSMAGLLAARVLSDSFDKVTIIERDQLPNSNDYRAGVPQARHLHTLLVKGQQIMEALFPGFKEDMVAGGAREIRWGRNTHFVSTGGYVKHFDSDIVSNSFGRTSLEWLVRSRLQHIPNIHFVTETQVEGLLTNQDRTVVTGVRLLSREDRTASELYGDLIVDASGRSSKAPQWLVELGYEAPTETIINAHTGYATRWYQAPANPMFKDMSYVIQPRASQGLYRGGGMMVVEGDQWVVTLIGANGDYPPTDEAGFLEFARSLASPAIYNILSEGTPISPIYGYRKLENQMRHYERLHRRPENFLITGDAACAFNPIYGQGMTAAGLEALALRDVLTNRQSLKGVAAEFQKKLNQLIQGPWLMATGEDMRYPNVEGAKPSLIDRMIHRYFDLVALAMPYDSAIGIRFTEVLNLLKPPTALLYPDVALRVFRHALLPHRKPAALEPRVTTETPVVA